MGAAILLFNFCKSLGISLEKIWSQKSLGIGLEKIWSQKKVSVSVSKTFGLEKKSRYRSRKHLVSKKSLGIGLENIWSRKKVSVSVSKILVSKKSIGLDEIFWSRHSVRLTSHPADHLSKKYRVGKRE